MKRKLTSLELCAGAGGQALGIEQAGFEHVGLVEIDEHCCATLEMNRPCWSGRVFNADLKAFDARAFVGVDLLAAGLPCPPFSIAGKKLGEKDERNLFPEALRVLDECGPRALMVENVRGILDPAFVGFRNQFQAALAQRGYESDFRLFNASDFGVSQLRPRVVFVAMRSETWRHFRWPSPRKQKPPTVGELLHPLMASCGWEGADDWRNRAADIGPTIVGGSKKHGGPDLGPTRARRAWLELDVDGRRLADAPPAPGFKGSPLLTEPMVALLQGFPAEWRFSGRKTHAYRQVGNAFPPPVAAAVAARIKQALMKQQDAGIGIEDVA